MFFLTTTTHIEVQLYFFFVSCIITSVSSFLVPFFSLIISLRDLKKKVAYSSRPPPHSQHQRSSKEKKSPFLLLPSSIPFFPL